MVQVNATCSFTRSDHLRGAHAGYLARGGDCWPCSLDSPSVDSLNSVPAKWVQHVSIHNLKTIPKSRQSICLTPSAHCKRLTVVLGPWTRSRWRCASSAFRQRNRSHLPRGSYGFYPCSTSLFRGFIGRMVCTCLAVWFAKLSSWLLYYRTFSVTGITWLIQSCSD